MTLSTAPAGPLAQALMDVGQIAALLHCSTRHVQRLAAEGRMPEPLRIGTLRRWQRSSIELWIANGCSATRNQEKGAHVS